MASVFLSASSVAQISTTAKSRHCRDGNSSRFDSVSVSIRSSRSEFSNVTRRVKLAKLANSLALLKKPSFPTSPNSKSSLGRLVVCASTSSESKPVTSTPTQSAKEIVPDNETSITKTSFGTIGLVVGVSLLSYGFGAYFTLLPGTEWSAIMLTYGFPLTLIGFALKYAELKPVPCVSYADAVALRDSQATPILLQVRSDVIRYRYGDEQHLEEALKRIFKYNQSGGIQRRFAPQLQSIIEEVFEGRYSLVLRFSAPNLDLKDFTQRLAKFTSFFGPGVTAYASEFEPKTFDVRLSVNPSS